LILGSQDEPVQLVDIVCLDPDIIEEIEIELFGLRLAA
jgi:hypothetical protein